MLSCACVVPVHTSWKPAHTCDSSAGISTAYKQKHKQKATCEPGQRKLKKKKRALVLASSRFTHVAYACVCVVRVNQPLLINTSASPTSKRVEIAWKPILLPEDMGEICNVESHCKTNTKIESKTEALSPRIHFNQYRPDPKPAIALPKQISSTTSVHSAIM